MESLAAKLDDANLGVIFESGKAKAAIANFARQT